jgi:putative membrane protein
MDRCVIEALQPWQPSLLVPAALVGAAWLYLRGDTHESYIRQTAFWIGLVAFYFATFTAFDYLAEHQFYMHRLQHAVLHHAAPLFIALAHPGNRLCSGLPRAARELLQRLENSQLVLGMTRVLNHPVVAVALFCGLIVLWLIPSIHFVAMLDVRLYKLMNWSVAINGLMFWSLVLNGSLQPAKRIAMLLAVVPPQIVMGLLLTWSSHDLYPVYTLCGRLPGVSALVDQQLGGAILWLSATMMSATGSLLVMSSLRQRR